MLSVLELFCDVDDFCQAFEPVWHQSLVQQGTRQRNRPTQLVTSEIMTIVIHFHQSGYRNFKAYYVEYVQEHLRDEFPQLVSYTRFIEPMERVLVPLIAYLYHCKGRCTGISFVDATSLAVCHNRRIARHRVFDGLAARGKTSMGWFYGFKLHLVINDRGELLAFQLTPGNSDDRQPVPILARALFGKLFADQGYISQALFEQLWAQNVQLITSVRRNMQNRLVLLMDKSIKSGIIDDMAKREFKLSEQQRIELIRAYEQAATPDSQRRIQAVRLYGEGRAVADIRDITGCSERSLRRWCAWYEHDGVARLADQRAGGNNAKLTPEQRAAVIERLKTYRPDQLLPADVRVSRGEFWTVSDLQMGLQRWYGVTWRSLTSYRALLHESRLSVQQVENTYRSHLHDLEVAEFEARLEKK